MAQKARKVLGADHSPFHSPLGSPAQITDFLYLGNLTAARNEALLKETGITYVINATAEASDQQYEGIECSRIRLEDHPNCNIGIHFDLIADKIEKLRQENQKIFVHCIAGVSRSATLVLAYLMKYKRMRLVDAHRLVKSKRPLIRPNMGFWAALVDYEKKLFHENTIVMVQASVGTIPSIYEKETRNLIW